MLGEIISIEELIIKIKLSINIENQSNLMNLHVIFEDSKSTFIGEIIGIDKDVMSISLLGEIHDNKLLTSTLKKPSFKANVRMIKLDELGYVYGNNEVVNKFYMGKSPLYNNYKIYTDINSLFSNHFAILGNTGSGKSYTVARLIQNLFIEEKFPSKSSIFIFDAYGEYNHAFDDYDTINSNFKYKKYTTETNYSESEILNIPLCLLDVDDLAILLGATSNSQLPIIEKALSFVKIFANNDPEVIKYKNSILANAILDILLSGENPNRIRDQVIALLQSLNTDELNLDTEIVQPGYIRNIRKCLYVDEHGKVQDVEAVVKFLNDFVVDVDYKKFRDDVYFDLKQLADAFDFALISEGLLSSNKVYDEANVLRVRLRSILDSSKREYFKYDSYITKEAYVRKLLTNNDNTKAQIINFNISYVDDRLAKALTKIISKILFSVSVRMKERGSLPFHIVIEEAHRYVQNDNDEVILGYNIFNRIAKEGRKYGTILILVSQRPSELSTTVMSQCTNFLVMRTQHPHDYDYIEKMLPIVNIEIIKRLKSLNPGSLIAFGNAFKIPAIINVDLPNPTPYSENVKLNNVWYD